MTWISVFQHLAGYLAASAIIPVATAELGKQWNNRNQSQPNPVFDQMGHPALSQPTNQRTSDGGGAVPDAGPQHVVDAVGVEDEGRVGDVVLARRLRQAQALVQYGPYRLRTAGRKSICSK